MYQRKLFLRNTEKTGIRGGPARGRRKTARPFGRAVFFNTALRLQGISFGSG